jgi:hypothetical protein
MGFHEQKSRIPRAVPRGADAAGATRHLREPLERQLTDAPKVSLTLYGVLRYIGMPIDTHDVTNVSQSAC